MKLRKQIQVSLLTIVSIMTSACNEQHDLPIRIGTNVWPGYEPLYVARELKNWDENDIRLIEYPNASEVIRGFRNKSIEAAALTLDEVLLLREVEIPVKIILVMDISLGGDVILAMPEIDSMAKVRGKRVAVESTALGAYVLSRALELNDMSIQDVEIKHLAVDAHQQAYLDNKVDVVVTFEPVRSQLLSAGAHEIFSSKDIPGEIVDVLVVHEDVIKNSKQKLQKLIEDWFHALQYMETSQDEALNIISRRLKISSDEIKNSFNMLELPDKNRNIEMLKGESATLYKNLQRLENTMYDSNLINKKLDTNNLLYWKLIN